MSPNIEFLSKNPIFASVTKLKKKIRKKEKEKNMKNYLTSVEREILKKALKK